MAGRLEGGVDLCPHHFIAGYDVCYRIAAPYSTTDCDRFAATPGGRGTFGGTAGKSQAPVGESTNYSLVYQFYPVGYSDMHPNAGDVFVDRYDDPQFFLWLFQVGDDRVDRLIYFLFSDR